MCNRISSKESKQVAIDQANMVLKQQQQKVSKAIRGRDNLNWEVQEVQQRLEDDRNRITPRSQAQENDEITRPTTSQ